ncbi:MAG: hypothetical protein QME90_13545 [Thermodesulfobacteriota bacterium]|nr:hypothetical protein [Thermodesulfobacteriota bacterium]
MMAHEKADKMERRMEEEICQTVADMIHKKSEEGQLISKKEIFQELIGQKILKSDPPEQESEFETILKKTMEGNSDLRELPRRDGLPRYYSSQCMSEPYIRILLCREEDPLLLIAEMVRENSSLYPKPVPIDIFSASPFDLTQEEILVCLGKMSGQEEYQDIAQTTTSTGTIFLYSSCHLDPGYASMLAEWFDVGQSNNP